MPRKLNYTKESDSPYKFMGAVLAHKGSYWTKEHGDDNYRAVTFHRVSFIQLWQDPKGIIWEIPMLPGELSDYSGESNFNIQKYIEEVINEGRNMEICLTCKRFIQICEYCHYYDEEKISGLMNEICDEIISGEIASTPELKEYFKSGVWGDLRTMKNDGSLYNEWKKDNLNPDGSLKH